MSLYHVSEEPNITRFAPRPAPAWTGLDQPVVWAVDEEHLPNYMLPRDAPRVCFARDIKSTEADCQQFGLRTRHVVAIENAWMDRLLNCNLFLYELPSDHFRLFERNAGYYITEREVLPAAITRLDPLRELRARDVELRPLESLWELHDAVAASTLAFSMIRMRNAIPPR